MARRAARASFPRSTNVNRNRTLRRRRTFLQTIIPRATTRRDWAATVTAVKDTTEAKGMIAARDAIEVGGDAADVGDGVAEEAATAGIPADAICRLRNTRRLRETAIRAATTTGAGRANERRMGLRLPWNRAKMTSCCRVSRSRSIADARKARSSNEPSTSAKNGNRTSSSRWHVRLLAQPTTSG